MAEGARAPEPPDRDPTVLGLAAAFAGLGSEPRGAVQQHHGRLHLVAVLPAGAAAPGAGLVAVAQERGLGKGGGVHGGLL
jgi:hypothetical protein